MVTEFHFRLNMPLMSKARPRFGQGRSYLPAKYREWKDAARECLKRIWETNELETLTQFEIHVEAHGPGRFDNDNLIGALLDSGIPDKKSGWAGAWKDDRVTVIPYLSIRWVRDQKQYWDVSVRVLSTGSKISE